MTVHVTPDALGPVTVRAHVGAEGVRVELFAPSDAGRDALRAILPELRRDLSGSGLSGTLDLSPRDQPAPQQDARGWDAGNGTGAGHGSGADRDRGGDPARASAPPPTAERAGATVALASASTIDLIV